MGSHLVDKLMMQGHEVTVVDNFFTGRKRNVEHWIGHENFELINHDVVNSLHIEGKKWKGRAWRSLKVIMQSIYCQFDFPDPPNFPSLPTA